MTRQGAGDGGLSPGDERDELLALLSHELRTPLSPLGGFVDTVLEHYDDQLGPDAERLLRVASRNAARLQQVIDQVLRTIRVMTDRSVVVGDVLLRPVLEQVAEEVAGVALVRVDVPDGLAATAGLDQLRLLFAELVENAVVHGAPPVECTAAVDGDIVELRVSDHGPGADPAVTDRMFEGFVQAASTLRRTQQGLGLGLRMAAALAHMAGGELGYDASGPGATFTVRLPLGTGRGTQQPLAAEPQDEAGRAPLAVRRSLAETRHRLTLIDEPVEARAALCDFVVTLGGQLVGLTGADDATVPVDLSMGVGDPIFARGARVAPLLEQTLPELVVIATTILSRGQGANYDAGQVVDLLAVDAVLPLRHDLDRRYLRGQPVDEIVDQVLRPALEEVGERWRCGDWSVADEHAATGLVEAVVASLELRLRHLAPTGPKVTLLGVPEDHHELPRRLLTLQLLEHDVGVRWLGSATPVASLARDLDEQPCDVLLLSCGFGPLLAGAIDLAAVAASRGIPVVLGGNGVLRHPGVAAATGCVVAPGDLEGVVDLLSSEEVPAVGATGLPGPWSEYAGAVRGEVFAAMAPEVLAGLTGRELSWLLEAQAIASWLPGPGLAVLEECLDVLAHSLEERGATAAAAAVAAMGAVR